MKKVIGYLPVFLVSTSLVVITSCNSGSSTSSTTDSTKTDTSSGMASANSTPATGGDTSSTMKTGTTNDANAAMTPSDIISKNINDNMTEIQMAKVGKDKGTDAQVKKAAQQMITDHTQMLADLKTLAGKKNVTVPAANTDMSSMPSLPDAKGKEFDQAWASQMLTAHEAKINELQTVQGQTQDADIKALVTKALPKIKMHREMLAKITGSTGSSQAQ